MPYHSLFLEQRNSSGIEAAVGTAKLIIFPRKGNVFQGIRERFIGDFLPVPAQQPAFEPVHRGFHPPETFQRGTPAGRKPAVRPFIADFAAVVQDVDDQDVNGVDEKSVSRLR